MARTINALLVVLAAAAILISGCAGTGVRTARPAPDFSVKLLTGEEVSLAQFRGRPLVLNVGASWCPHCQHEVPVLQEAYEKHKGDAGFLAVFVKSPKGDVEALVEKNGLKFMVGFDPEAAVGKAYGVRGIPVTFFIDGGGNLVDEYFGGIEKPDLEKKIEMLLKKP